MRGRRGRTVDRHINEVIIVHDIDVMRNHIAFPDHRSQPDILLAIGTPAVLSVGTDENPGIPFDLINIDGIETNIDGISP